MAAEGCAQLAMAAWEADEAADSPFGADEICGPLREAVGISWAPA